jgi:acetyl-CoA acetyltransferase
MSNSTPIVIGVGDFINRSKKIEDAVEPLQLMLSAIDEAVKDTGLSESSSRDLRAAVDSLDVVRTWTWPYPDLPGLIAEQFGIDPARKHYTDHGGNQPGLLFDEAARRISKGETKVAILTGGEALASCTCFAPILILTSIAIPSNPYSD